MVTPAAETQRQAVVREDPHGPSVIIHATGRSRRRRLEYAAHFVGFPDHSSAEYSASSRSIAQSEVEALSRHRMQRFATFPSNSARHRWWPARAARVGKPLVLLRGESARTLTDTVCRRSRNTGGTSDRQPSRFWYARPYQGESCMTRNSASGPSA